MTNCVYTDFSMLCGGRGTKPFSFNTKQKKLKEHKCKHTQTILNMVTQTSKDIKTGHVTNEKHFDLIFVDV